MRGHSRPLGVRRAIAQRHAAIRARHEEKVRDEAADLLRERGYLLTAFTFRPGRGTYRIGFVASDDAESRYEAPDETILLTTIRTYPPRIPCNPAAPLMSRFLNASHIAMSFVHAGRAAFASLGRLRAPYLTVTAPTP